MLGEDHSLILEFPQYKERIAELCNTDKTFADDAEKYHAIDEDIRELELNGTPTDDDTMPQKKAIRARLKDILYQCLSNS
jgi:uncharacterized protein YdcH (DUF465 family)